jgi:hypothetical protein
MSWSINLSGPPEVVTRELADAILLLDRAIDYSQNSDADSVRISVGGYVSWNEDHEITSSDVSFSVAETTNPKKLESVEQLNMPSD